MGLFTNEVGADLAYAKSRSGETVSEGAREVSCYPPVSEPLSSDLTPLQQIAQHAERLFAELLAHTGEIPSVEASITSGDNKRTTLRLLVGPCPPAQACQAMALVGPLNEGMPSTHLLDGCVAGVWRIDKLDIANDRVLSRDNYHRPGRPRTN